MKKTKKYEEESKNILSICLYLLYYFYYAHL